MWRILSRIWTRHWRGFKVINLGSKADRLERPSIIQAAIGLRFDRFIDPL